MSVTDHIPPRSEPPLLRPPVRPGSGAANADPLASFAFWGRDGIATGRPRGVAWLERLRGDRRVGAIALLAVALLAGLLWYRIGVDAAAGPVGRSASPRSKVARMTSTSTTRGTNTKNAKDDTNEVVVDVAGAVARPGIVRLRTGDRVVDAIAAAGGASPGADLDQLNLAAKVVDGQRIAVGLPGQPATALASPGGTTTTGDGLGGSTTGPLNLNTATQTEIESLPGIGPVLGAAILRERDQRGGFRSVDELRSVHGIGEKRFEDLRDLVTV